MLFLKSLPKHLKAYNDFKWPKKVGAIVTATSWDPRPVCGGGLHGLVNGDGDTSLLNKRPDATWIAFESVDAAGNPSDKEAIAFDHKGKCHHAIIRAIGTHAEATDWLLRHGCKTVYGGHDEAGQYGTATAGDSGTAKAGGYGVAIAGNSGSAAADVFGHAHAGICGNATAGDCGSAIVDNNGTATAGNNGLASAKHDGIATAGDNGLAHAEYAGKATGGHWAVAIAGRHGKATTGNYGTAIVKDDGDASVGDHGVAIVGYSGTATAGHRGILMIRYQGDLKIARVGENGIKPNTPYRLDELGNFIEARDDK